MLVYLPLKFELEAEADILRQLIHTFFICIRSPGMLLLCLCMLRTQLSFAEGMISLDKDSLDSRSPGSIYLSANSDQPINNADEPDLRLRNGLIIGAGATLVAVYGSNNWWSSGFGGGFDTVNEGWFGPDTQFGGADKLGHLYSNYAGVRLLAPLFESAGNSREASVSLAAWSALGIYTAVEIIDGYSRTWKFSPQDEIANITGALFGVAAETYPELDAIIDFRVDYRRSPRASKFDPFGDYSAQKYLLVVKADGFAPLRENKFLRYFELAFGYGTRGYDTGGTRSRDTYLGLSLNLARLLADGAYEGRLHTTAFQRGTDRLFDLVQFPTVVYERHSLK